MLQQVARGGRRGAERGPGLLLGDDGDWNVHAAQVGVMAAGFAVLTALCSGGACLVPESADWIPGLGDEPARPPVEMRELEPLRSPH